jgi:hypothetical protein
MKYREMFVIPAGGARDEYERALSPIVDCIEQRLGTSSTGDASARFAACLRVLEERKMSGRYEILNVLNNLNEHCGHK